MNFVYVGFGGAVGSLLRYSISLLPYKGTFPFLTLATNLIGALAIGLVMGLASRARVSQKTVLLLAVGVCGGFTTFSTFSLESYTLMKAGSYLLMGAYIFLSVVLCIVGISIGMLIAEKTA